LHELPDRRKEFGVLGPDAAEAVQWLNEQGWLHAAVVSESDCPTPSRLWAVNPFLEQLLPTMELGFAVDFGCGGGREAVALASCGWRVLAVDNLRSNLDRGEDLARRYLPSEFAARITWRFGDMVDIAQEQLPFDLGLSLFAVDRNLYAKLDDQCSAVVIEAFTAVHRDHTGRPRLERLVVEPDELPTLFPKLEVIRYEEGWLRERHTARLYARRAL
jgi:SAM-dependent methyltransferase